MSGCYRAGATQLAIRVIPPTKSVQVWATTFAATVIVSVIGYMIIERNRPIPDQGAPAANTMQQDGVPS